MTLQRKRSPAPQAPDLDFDATQEIDSALAESRLVGGNDTLTHGDFDDTEILLEVGGPAKPAPRRR